MSGKPIQTGSPSSPTRTQNFVLLLAAGLVLAFAFWLNTFHLTNLTSTRGLDEAVYLSAARLLRLGYAFETFYFDQPPVFVDLIRLAFQVGGDSLFVGRLLVVAFSMIALAALAPLPRLFAAPFAIPLALGLTATTPYFFRYARAVLGEVPAVALILLALFAVIHSSRTRDRRWLLASAVCFAIGVAIKPIVVGFGVAMVLVLWLGAGVPAPRAPQNGRERLTDIVTFGLASTLILIPTLQLYRVNWFLDEVMGLHFAEHQQYSGQPFAGVFAFLAMAWANAPVCLLAIPGFFAAVYRNFVLTLCLLGGMAAAWIIVLALPPYNHHYAVFMPFLGLFAGIGVTEGIRLVLSRFTQQTNSGTMLPRPWTRVYFGLLVLCLLGSGFRLPGVIALADELLTNSIALNSDRLNFVSQHVVPGTFVMSDNAMLVYLSGTLIPPCGLILVYAVDLPIIPDSTHRLDECLKIARVQTVLQTEGYAAVPGLPEWFQARYPAVIRGPEMQLYQSTVNIE